MIDHADPPDAELVTKLRLDAEGCVTYGRIYAEDRNELADGAQDGAVVAAEDLAELWGREIGEA